jgi:hypothetical protein
VQNTGGNEYTRNTLKVINDPDYVARGLYGVILKDKA